MLCLFFTLNDSYTNVFNLIYFLLLIISVVFGFIIFTFVCFYDDLRTALTFLIMNIILISILYTGRILFNSNNQLQRTLFLSCTFSITISLCILLFLTYNKVIRKNCTDKGHFFTKLFFFFICDAIPFIFGIVFYYTNLFVNETTLSFIYSLFMTVMMITNLLLGVRMLSVINNIENKKTRVYPIRISLFILSHFLTNINMLIIEIIILVDSTIQINFYRQLSELLTNLQALLYSFSFIFYPSVISTIKGLLINKKANEALPTQSLYHSVFDIENTISNSVSQSRNQTIYD